MEPYVNHFRDVIEMYTNRSKLLKMEHWTASQLKISILVNRKLRWQDNDIDTQNWSLGMKMFSHYLVANILKNKMNENITTIIFNSLKNEHKEWEGAGSRMLNNQDQKLKNWWYDAMSIDGKIVSLRYVPLIAQLAHNNLMYEWKSEDF